MKARMQHAKQLHIQTHFVHFIKQEIPISVISYYIYQQLSRLSLFA